MKVMGMQQFKRVHRLLKPKKLARIFNVFSFDTVHGLLMLFPLLAAPLGWVKD